MSRTFFDVLIRAVFFSSFLFATAGLAAVPAKVDPRVWQDTEGGNTASFLVLLTEQSDSKGKTKNIVDHKEKRRAVVAGLRETADRTQGDLIALLARSGMKHRSYWVANVVAVEGKRGLVQALVNRDDVKAIESNRAFR